MMTFFKDTFGPVATVFRHFTVRLGEWLEIIRPELVATVDYVVEWPICMEEPELGLYEETITFYLFEYLSGRRDWRVYEYDKCEELSYHDTKLRDILMWEYGGPLPANWRRPGEQEHAQVINLRVVKGGA